MRLEDTWMSRGNDQFRTARQTLAGSMALSEVSFLAFSSKTLVALRSIGSVCFICNGELLLEACFRGSFGQSSLLAYVPSISVCRPSSFCRHRSSSGPMMR